MALIAAETLAGWRACFVALDEMLAGLQGFDEMPHNLPHNAALELTPELTSTFIASISAISRTADAIGAELEKATAE